MILMGEDHFWSSICGGPAKSGALFVTFFAIVTEPKVDEFGIEIFVYQDVLVFDIAMDDFARMTVRNGFHNLLKDAAGDLGLKRGMSHHVGEKVSSFNILHDDEEEGLGVIS